MAASILRFNPVSDRIITAQFQGNPIYMSVIQVYAPTAESEEIIHDLFYETLQETLNNISKGDMVLVMGDFNAKIGACEGDQYIVQYGLGSRNESGDRLHQF